MNAANVSRVLSLIPDRIARTQMGGLFDPANTAACAHPERIAHLVQFLTWLGPLQPLTKEDLRQFGLVTPYGRPAIEAPAEDEADALDAELDAEIDAEIELAAPLPAATVEVEQEPALT
jgi:hypothetical protein